MPSKIDCDITTDFITGELLGVGVGGKANDGSIVLVVAVAGLPAQVQVGISYEDAEDIDELIETLRAAREQAWGPKR